MVTSNEYRIEPITGGYAVVSEIGVNDRYVRRLWALCRDEMAAERIRACLTACEHITTAELRDIGLKAVP